MKNFFIPFQTDIFLTWGKVGLKIWTHKIGGLSENNFILVAKADEACPAMTAAR